MTNIITKFIDAGIIRSISISQNWQANTHTSGPNALEQVREPKYKVNVRWEWATDSISFVNSLEELDRKLLDDVERYGEQYLRFIETARKLKEENAKAI